VTMLILIGLSLKIRKGEKNEKVIR